MNVPPITLTVAVDPEQLRYWRLSWPTWRVNAPQLLDMPLVVFCDGCEPLGWWRRQLVFVDHPNIRLVPWIVEADATQRHKMLSAFVYGVADAAETEWTLKIDLDCAKGNNDDGWITNQWVDEWFDDSKWYVFVASKWGYAKPASLFEDMQTWAETVPAMNGTKPLEATIVEGKAKYSRTISYVQFTRRSYLRYLAGLHPGRLMPIASQDGWTHYVAERMGLAYARTKFAKWGWSHSKGKLLRHYEALGLQNENGD